MARPVPFSLPQAQHSSRGGNRALEGYDIEKLYVERESLAARGIREDQLLVPVQVVDAKEMAALMEQQDVIIGF